MRTDEDKLSSSATALDTLKFIGDAKKRSLREVIAYLGRPKSTVLRILETLVSSGLVRRVSPGEYSITFRLWRMACNAFDYSDVRTVLKTLAEQTGETAVYAVYDDGLSVHVAKVDSDNPVTIALSVGSTAPVYATATGKALLSHQPAAEIDSVLSNLVAYTSHTNTNEKALRAELELVRRRGIAFNYGEWREGVAGAASPVFDRTRQVIGAVGVACPQMRVEEKLDALGATVLEAARQISTSSGAPDDCYGLAMERNGVSLNSGPETASLC